jgi:hypothetical protein
MLKEASQLHKDRFAAVEDRKMIERRKIDDNRKLALQKLTKATLAEREVLVEAVEELKSCGVKKLATDERLYMRNLGEFLSEPKLPRFSSSDSKLCMPYFVKFFTPELLKCIAKSINGNIKSREGTDSQRNTYICIDEDDILNFVLMRYLFQIERKTIKESFSPEYRTTLFNEYDYLLGRDKFNIINSEIRNEKVWSAMEPLFSSICQSNWTTPAVTAIDELIEPDNTTDSRTIFMERKPHPFGFLVYPMCLKSSRTDLPYVWSAIFQNKHPLSSPIVAYNSLVSRALTFKNENDPPSAPPLLVVADSAFGGVETVIRASRQGYYAINAMSSAAWSPAFNVASVALTKGLNRTALRILDDADEETKFGIVSFTLFQDEGTCFTASNAFEVRKVDLSSPSALILQSSQVEMPKMDEKDSINEDDEVENIALSAGWKPLSYADYKRGLEVGSPIEAEYFDDGDAAEWYSGIIVDKEADKYEVEFEWGVETITETSRIRWPAENAMTPPKKGQKRSRNVEASLEEDRVKSRRKLPPIGSLFSQVSLSDAKILASLTPGLLQKIIHMASPETTALGSNSLQMISAVTGFEPDDLTVMKKKKEGMKKYEDLTGKQLEARLKLDGLKLTGTVEDKAARLRRVDYLKESLATCDGMANSLLGEPSDSDDRLLVDTYSQHFNYVDRFNRYYYQLEIGLRKRKPVKRAAKQAFCPFPQTALGILAVNAWVSRCEISGTIEPNLKNFIKTCVRERMSKKNERKE